MCGGILEQIPCSRVGHVYRKNSPYSYPEGKKGYIQAYNKYRTVNVWLDEWIPFYDLLNPGTKCSGIYAPRCMKLSISFH